MQGPTRNLILVLTLLTASLTYGFSPDFRIRSAATWKWRQITATKLAATPSKEQGDWTQYSERQKGLLVLTTVPFAWGTFEPAVRYVYTMDPPVPGFVFSTCSYLVAAVTLLGAAWFTTTMTNQPERDQPPQSSWPVLGGTELGLYLFLGNALQVLGLKTIGADRAAFLLQLTTLFVPLLQRNISLRTWASCLIALVGVGVMGLEGKEAYLVEVATRLFSQPAVGADSFPQQDLIPTFSNGDTYVIVAAAMYSMHCIRLESYVKATSALRLAACKASAETLLSASVATLSVLSSQSASDKGSTLLEDTVASNVVESFSLDTGREIVNFVDRLVGGMADSSIPLLTLLPAGLAILWTGWITCGYTIYAQSYGQRRVSPVTANLIYTIQPVCTAIAAWLVLGETLAPAGFLGGSLIAAAIVFVATEEDN